MQRQVMTGQLGVSRSAHKKLQRMLLTRQFNSPIDAYKFSVVLALSRGGIAARGFQADVPILDAEAVINDETLVAAVKSMRPAERELVARTVERLGEWGFQELARRENAVQASAKGLLSSPGSAEIDISAPVNDVAGEIALIRRILNAMPTMVLQRPLDGCSLPRRAENGLAKAGVKTIADLDAMSDVKLKGSRNIGKKSLADIKAALYDVLQESVSPQDGANDGGSDSGERVVAPVSRTPLAWASGAQPRASDLPMANQLSAGLSRLNKRESMVLRGRLGYADKQLTLQDLANELNLTRERVRQIETTAVKKAGIKKIANAASNRIRLLLGQGNGAVYLCSLADRDDWFRDIDCASSFLLRLLKKYAEPPIFFYGVGKTKLATKATKQDIDNLSEQVMARVAEALKHGVTRLSVRQIITAGARQAGFPGAAELIYQTSLCKLHFSEGAREDDDELLAIGKNMEARVEAVLREAGEPMHFRDIAARVAERTGKVADERVVQNALPRSSAVLMSRGVYGLPEWLEIGLDTKREIAATVQQLMGSKSSGRQWHARELLKALSDCRPDFPLPSNTHELTAILKSTSELKYLGRQVWTFANPHDPTSIPRLEIRDLCKQILERAGRPLESKDLRAEIELLRGVSSVFQIHADEELVKLGPSLWGLKGRDVEA